MSGEGRKLGRKRGARIGRASILLAALLLGPGAERAVACACCSDEGLRIETRAVLSSGEAEEIGRIVLAPRARLRMGPGYPDDVHGIAAPGDGWLDIAARWVDGGIEFDVGSPGGAGGRIAVSLERVLERFEVDTGRGEGMSAGGGPDLYKEWRMIGRAELSGALFTATSPAKARLILQGGGNLCTSAESFARWMLILKGGGADFALLGETVRAGDGN